MVDLFTCVEVLVVYCSLPIMAAFAVENLIYIVYRSTKHLKYGNPFLLLILYEILCYFSTNFEVLVFNFINTPEVQGEFVDI